MKINMHNARNVTHQWDALETLRTHGNYITGLELYEKLARLEAKANRLATRDCNGNPTPENWEEGISRAVGKLFGKIPNGFFINHDPRGYTLKISEEHKPDGMQTDWGSYGILAPTY